ncbi:MAG: ribonuclease HI family protein [Planctomycetota bacterium]|nr:ribonuclease HI family protein [Planctomycetota bacterium]
MSNEALRLIANIDGGARGNPGPAGAGVVLRDAADGAVVYQAGLYLGKATNNVAEYRALLAACKTAGDFNAAEVEVFSDSELLVRQMNGEYRVKNAGLKPLFEEALRLAGVFGRFTVRHVRREDNKDADQLANQAINLRRNVEDAE